MLYRRYHHHQRHSKTFIRTYDTRYFVDPGIAAEAMRIGPKDLMNDLNTFGFLFETLCIRDLRVYAEAIDGHVFHYRDKTELECDEAIAQGVKTLDALEAKINTEQMSKPAFKAVVTAVGTLAYRRADGIWQIQHQSAKLVYLSKKTFCRCHKIKFFSWSSVDLIL